MSNSDTKIAVLGAGSWGTALAIGLGARHPVSLWGHTLEEVEAMRVDRENRHYLPGIPFPSALQPTQDLRLALHDAREVLVVVPSHAFAGVCQHIAELEPELPSLSWASKGFDPKTQMLLSTVASAHLPRAELAVISGPSFAREVAMGLPTAITVASPSRDHAKRVVGLLRSRSLRPYTSTDMVGVQVGGACKNVMAIAAGISDGLGFGANARAALITRGLREITRLGLALGGQMETFMGLTGLGDLTLTCTDDQSRNRRMGLALAQGKAVDEARREIGQEVEGVNTTREVRCLALRLNVEMPITEQTYKVLYEGLKPQTAVENLLSRETRTE